MNLLLIALLMGGGPIPIRTNFIPQVSIDQHLITLKSRTIDTELPSVLADFDDMETPVHFLVHFSTPIKASHRQILESNDFHIESYLPHGAFLVKGSPKDAKALKTEGVIDWFGAYLPKDKIAHSLKNYSGDTTIEIMLFENSNFNQVIDALKTMGATIDNPLGDEWNIKITATVNSEQFIKIAAIDAVRWIEPRVDVELHNNRIQWVIQTWENNNRRIWDKGLHGEGIIGSTCDSGIRTDHIMFRDSTIDITKWGDYPNHRKIIAYKPTTNMVVFGDEGGSIRWHGSHTANTVCGDDSYWEGTSNYDGMAPKARNYFMDFDGRLTGLTADYRTMYEPPYQGNSAGKAKFSSNSWGDKVAGYTSHSWETDKFIWEHPDYLILFSAGNDATYISSPSTAKNIVTVGATMNGSSAQAPANFSGTGPTPDGRIKPTVTAPGVDVMSASGTGRTAYQSMDGTSMSCPAVAGASALLIQYLREGWYPSGAKNSADSIEPSAALLKAMLISSALSDFNTPTPNGKVGWGRVALDSALYFSGDTKKLYLDDNSTGLQTGDLVAYEIGIQSDSVPLKVVLVWTDAPPEMSASKQLINNIDLEVYTPSGQLYSGNNFKNNYSQKGGTPDNTNVVEVVKIEAPTSGTWSIKLKGTQIPEGPQPYALVITGDLDYHDINLSPAGMQIDDKTGLKPNSGLDAGETAILYPQITNSGSFDAQNVIARLSTDEKKIDIKTKSVNYGNISAGKSAKGTGFTVYAAKNLPDSQKVSFTLDIEANGGNYVKSLLYSILIGVGIEESTIESLYSLEATDSPFSEHIAIRLAVPVQEPLKVEIFDKTGRKIKTLLNNPNHPAGIREYTFPTTDEMGMPIPAGIYFIRMTTAEKQITCKGLQLR